jgi:hypothetical protein
LTRERRVGLVCAAIALAIAGVAVVATLGWNGWKISVLVRMSSNDPIAPYALKTDPGFELGAPGVHYDGVYYYAIARDPLARGVAHGLIDRPAYRYGHAGYGWLAWALSGGRGRDVPLALLEINLVAIVLAAFGASALARAYGWSAWGGLVVAFNPGVVYATTIDTSEVLGIALLVWALLAWTRCRWTLAAVALTALCLVKEAFLLVPIGLAVWELVEVRRGRGAADLGRRLALLAIGPVVYTGWYVYLRERFGHFPFQEARDLTTLPFRGWWDSFHMAATMGMHEEYPYPQIGQASIPLMATVGGVLLFALVLSLRLRTRFDPVFALLAGLGFCLTWLGVLFPKDLIRELAIPLALAPAVFAGAVRPPQPAPSSRSQSAGHDA